MLKRNKSSGFTLIEMLVVLAIIVIFVAVSVVAFQAMYRESALRAGAGEVYGSLTNARSNTLASQDDTVYGVHFSTSSVTRFVGAAYSVGSTTNKTYTFEGGVTATSTLITNGTNIVFTRLTGRPSASGTIYVRNNTKTSTTTIVIYASGLIEYQ